MNSKLKYIVKSLLETDMYKFFMWQVMLHKNPTAWAEYSFLCRNTPEYPLSELAADVNAELDHLCSLSFQPDELQYLRDNTVLSADFIDFLSQFKFQRKFIQVSVDGDALRIDAKGPQIQVMGFEIPCLFIVSELYFKRFDSAALMEESRKRLLAKIQLIKDYPNTKRHPFTFFDAGLRRRWSGEWQDELVLTLQKEVPGQFRGTSNVYLAKKHGLSLFGTMAHEYMQSYQATSEILRDFQKNALTDWLDEFDGKIGIALTDTISMDAFLEDFDGYFANRFKGMRHDSGCPYLFGEKALKHYAKLNIDSNTKALSFSDGLNVPKALSLNERFGDDIDPPAAIGTDLDNDTGIKPLNIVMKLMRLNGKPVAKLSDSPGKTLCEDTEYVELLADTFNYNLEGNAVNA